MRHFLFDLRAWNDPFYNLQVTSTPTQVATIIGSPDIHFALRAPCRENSFKRRIYIALKMHAYTAIFSLQNQIIVLTRYEEGDKNFLK